MKDLVYFVYDKVAKRYLDVSIVNNHDTFKRSFSSHLLNLMNDPKYVNSLRVLSDCDIYFFSFDNGLPCQERMQLLFHVKDLISDLKTKNGIKMDKVDK